MSDPRFDTALEILGQAQRPVVSTGAGMSRESGIPTFRDALGGLWSQFDPEELATEHGFRAAPERVWGWYTSRRRRIRRSAPHAGHYALARMEALLPGLTVVTQNIDGLHQAAGSTRVIELHGNIHRASCLDRRHPFMGELDGDPGVGEEDAEIAPPPCPLCGSPLRPDVVWFGEILPEEATREAWRLAERCDVMLVVGTSGIVWPAAELPFIAARAGARVIEVNPEPSEVTRIADVILRGPAGEVLPRLAESLASSPTSTETKAFREP